MSIDWDSAYSRAREKDEERKHRKISTNNKTSSSSIDWESAYSRARERDEERKRVKTLITNRSDTTNSAEQKTTPKPTPQDNGFKMISKEEAMANPIKGNYAGLLPSQKDSGSKAQAQVSKTTAKEHKEQTSVANEYHSLDNDVMADVEIMATGKNAEGNLKGVTGFFNKNTNVEKASKQQVANAKAARQRLLEKGYTETQVDTWANMRANGQNQEFRENAQKDLDAFAEKHPVLASLTSTAYKFATLPVDVALRAEQAVSGEFDTTSAADTILQGDEMLRSSVAEDIAKDYGEGWAKLYNVGMSGVDSVVAAIMPGGQYFLAADAATSTMRDLSERGLSHEKIVAGGLFAGAAEWFFERFSIGDFKKLKTQTPAGALDYVKNFFKSSGVNISEEAATELANIVWDTAVNGDKSNRSMMVKQFVEQGVDPEQAEKMANLKLVNQVVEAGLAGGLMGGTMNVTGSAIGAAINYKPLKSAGQAVKADGKVDAVLQQAANAPKNSSPQQAYQRAQKKIDKGKSLSDRDVGLVATTSARYIQENAPELNGVFKSAKTKEDVEAIYNAERYRIENSPSIPKEAKSAIKALDADYKLAKASIENYNLSGARAMSDSARQSMTETDTVKTKMPTIGKTEAGEVISVSSVESVNDGIITVKTSEGTTQALDIKKDIKSVDAQTLWTNAAQSFPDADSAQAYIDNYDGGSIADYTKAFKDYYNLAATGLSLERINEQNIAPYYDLTEQAQAAAVEMGRKSMQFQQGVVDLSVTPKTKAQQLQMNMLDEIGKHTGLNFVVVDKMKDEGFYKTGSNQVVLSLGSSKGLMLRTAGHETYHYVQTALPDNAKEIETFALDTLKKNKGEKWVNDRLKYYEKLGYEGKQKQIDELVADSLFDAFTSKRAVEQFAEKNQSVVQKISNHIKQLIADIKNILNKLKASGDYAEIKAWQDDLASLEKLNNMFLDTLDELAVKKTDNTAETKNTAEAVDKVLFSIKRFTLTESDIHNNMLLVGKMNSVADLSGNEFAKGSIGLPDQVDAFFAKYNYTIENPDIGDVEINRRGAKDSIAHGIGRTKAASFAAVPYTIEKGKIIDYQKNWKGRQYDTIVLAAPISINNERYYQGVIVIRDNSTQRFYLHEVLTEKESNTSFKTGVGAKHTPGDVSPSLISLLKKVRDVNNFDNDNISFSVNRSVEDSDYLTAVNNGDMETAQRLVDEAAKAAEYTFKLFHQTENDFTVFDTNHKGAGTGDYETPFGIFMKPTDSNIGLKGQKQMPLYAKIKNPLVVHNRESLMRELKDAEAVTAVQDKIKEANSDYKSKVKQAGKDLQNYLIEYRKSHPDEPRSDIYKDKGFNEIYDREDSLIEEWSAAVDELALEAKSAITEYLKNNGYDGVIIEEDVGSFGRKTKTYIALDNTQVKSSDPVTYDDNGDIIPPSQRFNEENDDIRYSRNRDTSISEEASDYILDTKEYREILAIVDQRFETTGRKELSPKAIDRLAGKLLTKSKSNYSREQLTERLTALFDYIANSRDLEWSDVTSIAAEISKDVLKESQTLDRSMQNEYADVLKLMRESKVYISPEVKQEIAYNFGSYDSFRRTLGNKLKVTATDTSAVPLDVFWRELSENRPEMFDADTNYLDMPSAIADFLDMTSPQYINPYDIEMDMDEAAYDFALQIYDEYFNIPEVISEAKKHQYEIEKLKGKYNAKINELHNTYRERIKKLRKEKNNKIEATKALYKQRHEAYREKRNETQNKQKLRASIYRTSKALVDKLVKPTDQKHIPQELISSVNEFAKAITESGVFTPDKAMRLKKAFKAIGENGTDADANLSTMYNEEFAEMFEELQDTIAGRRLTELNSSELETVRDTIKYVAHVVSMSNRAFSDGIKERLGVLQNDALEEFSKQNPDRKRVKFEIQKGLLKPVTFFELLESPTLMKLYENIRWGEGKWYNTIDAAKKRRQEAAKEYNYKSWKNDTVTIKPERFNGNITLSIGEALSIYATANRQQGVDHLLLGGIVREEDAKKKLDRKKKAESVDVRSDNIPLTIKDISEITSKLTKEQRGYADNLVEYMSTDMASLGNEVSMRLFGIKKFNEQKYFPLKSASNFLFSKPAVESDARIKHMSMTKPTTPKANNPVVIGDFTETVMNHCNDMALYYSFCLPLEDFNRVYNFKTQPTTLERPTSIKQKIDAAYGSKANSYIKQLLTDINGGVTQQAGAGFVNKMIAKAKKNAVFGSLSVAVQQPSAVTRAFLYVDPKYFVSSTFNKRDWDELKKYAPVAGVKEMGYFDTNVGKQAVDWMSEDGYDGLKEKAFALFKDKDYRDDKLSFLPSYMDRITWGHIWNAVKKETAHNNPDMDRNSEEFLKLAGERFTYVIDRTQVYDSVFARSEWMRSKDTGVKVATAFMSEPLTNYNMLYSAAVKARHGDLKFGAKALSAYLVSVAFNSILKSLVTAGRDDDEDKSYWEKYLSHVVGNFVDEPFGMVPYLKDFVSLLQGYDSKRMDTQALADVADAVMIMFDDNKSGWEKFKSAFGAVGIAAGIPFKNLVRDGEMIYRGVKDIYDGKKQPTTEKGIEYAVKDELGIDVPTKYDQLIEAYLERDEAHYEKVNNNLKASKSDSAISSGIKTAVKNKYQAGVITEVQATDVLQELLDYDKNKAYWTIDEWSSEDKDYAKYNDFSEAIRTGNDLKDVINDYLDHGVTKKTLAGQITKTFKQEYVELYWTDRAEASALRRRILDAYVELGYDRDDKADDITDWLEENK